MILNGGLINANIVCVNCVCVCVNVIVASHCGHLENSITAQHHRHILGIMGLEGCKEMFLLSQITTLKLHLLFPDWMTHHVTPYRWSNERR